MDRFMLLPQLIENSDWHEQEKRAKDILNQYYSGFVLPPQKMLSEVVNVVSHSEYRQIFIDSMLHLKTEKLYKSSIHGQDHIERVCLLAAYLAIRCSVEKQTFKVCLEAAKYHDIGRRDDSEDRLHGYRGSKNIPVCCEGFGALDCEMISAVVEAHSLLDEEAREVFNKYGLLKQSDYKIYLQLLHIIKDADALDRFRLTDHSLKVNLLRIPESVSVVQAACEMNMLPIRWKAAVVSWTEETANVIQWIKNCVPDIEIKYILEKDYFVWNEKVEQNIEIISIEHGIELYKHNKINKIIIPCIKKGMVLSSMYIPLCQKGVYEQDILYAPYRLVYGVGKNDISIEQDQALCEFRKRTELDRIELHINDHCNLSCANCSMFAGLVEGDVNTDFETTKRALLSLKRIYSHICEIDLIGGEPLLNPQIGEYCVLLRKLFPDSYIFIVSNGILVPQMEKKLIDIISNNNIYLSVTYYPGYAELIRRVKKICEENDIKLELLPKRVNFVKLYDLSGKASKEEMFYECKRKYTIIAMRENKLAVCYAPFAFPYAEEKFKIGYKAERMIDLFEEGLTNEKIMRRFAEPMDCCRYCHNDTISWEQSTESMCSSIKTWSY